MVYDLNLCNQYLFRVIFIAELFMIFNLLTRTIRIKQRASYQLFIAN